jgi:hypothetical protein
METITIASLEPKEKLTFITTTDNRKLRVWNDKAARFGLEQGGTFDVETEAGQYGTHITKAKRAISAPAAQPVVAGTYRQSTLTSASPDSPMSKDEQIFVQGMVQAFIRSGEVSLDNAEAAVNKMRGIWKRTLGRAMIQHQIAAE